jgi:hypothetical protein
VGAVSATIKKRRKSDAEIKQDVAAFLGGDVALYWPGGSGGGGSRKRLKGKAPVVRPHASTSPSCRRCGQFHSTAEHELETGGDQQTPMPVGSPRSRSRARGKAPRTAKATATEPTRGGGGAGGGGKKAVAERVFVGTFPTGISYADRAVEVGGDYKRLAFLPFDTLVLEWSAKRIPSDMRDYIERDAARLQARSGEDYKVSQAGQTVVLGGMGAKKSKRQLDAEIAAVVASRPSQPASSPLLVVRDALKRVKGPGRFGDRKVFVSALWQRVGRQLGMPLDEFKRWLASQHRAGALQLARADLVAAMDPHLVASSEIRDRGAEFHFVVDPEAKEPW